MGNSRILLQFDLSLFWLLLFFVGLFFVFVNSISNDLLKGPPSYPIVGTLCAFLKNRHRFLEWITELLCKSPSCTFSLHGGPGGIQGVITANPANVEHILKTNFHNYPKGERFTFFLHDFLGRGIFNVDGEQWKMQRKAASHEFNTKSIRNFVVETVQWEIRNRFMAVLSNACEREESLDLQDVLQRFAFDNICRVAFGVDPGCLHSSLPTSRFSEAFDDATDISSGRFMYAIPFLWRIKRMLNLGSERRLQEAIQVVDELAMEIIRSRRNELSADQGTVCEDLLSRFMAVMTSPGENKELFDEERHGRESSDLFLKDMIISFILAGRDTTSSALTWFFWLLSSHPRAEDAIRHEILRVLSNRNVEIDSVFFREDAEGSALFSYEELKEMHYLHAALCESMRLYPPVPIDSKIAAEDDVLPDGTCVSKGSFVGYSIYSMGRMVSIWGSDCEQYKPERWLKNGEFVGENPYKFPVFQAGPRICLGKEMAFIQMKSIVASIIHKFRLKVNSGCCPKYTLSITMRMEGGLAVSVRNQ
eukprot:Gb_08311 [translate_table: standard]